MSGTGKSKANNVVNLAIVRGARQKALTEEQIEQRAPHNNNEKRLTDPFGDERRLLWVSNAESELLSYMYQHGVNAATMRSLINGGAQ